MWNLYKYIAYLEKGGEHKMEVTDVRLRRVNTEGRMRAIASITLDHEFVVHDIRVIDGNNGLFVAMPSKRTQMENSVTLHIQLILVHALKFKMRF